MKAKTHTETLSNSKEFLSSRLRLTIAVALLALHFMLGLDSMNGKSFTFDEPVFMAGGLTSWRDNDFSTNPEGGLFTQKWGTLPLIFDKSIQVPKADIRTSKSLTLLQWKRAVNMVINSTDAYTALTKSRIMILLLSVFCGWLVWRISTRIFGLNGGLLSLALYSFSPTILANGTLITADMAAATAFLAAIWCGWKMMRKITLKRFIFCALTALWVITAKMSGLLIGPVLLLMGIVRIIRGGKLHCIINGKNYLANTRFKQLKVLAFTGLALSVVIWIGIRGAYSFRFSMIPGTPNITSKCNGGTSLLSSKYIASLNDQRYLPEAYLYGLDYTLKNSTSRPAYLLGEKYTVGRWYFFPFSFLVKTPLPVLLLLLLSGIAAGFRVLTASKPCKALRQGLWRTVPLWSFAAIYIALCLSSGLNIGHRHLLPLYPVLFIFCGGIISKSPRTSLRVFRFCGVILAGWLAVECFLAYPNYIAFFNRAAGNKNRTYRLMSDSSLDWGQELWNLQEFLNEANPPGKDSQPVYVSVLSILPPKYYLPRQQVITLPMFADYSDKIYDFDPGWYCFSATMLNGVYNPTSGGMNGNPEKYVRLQQYLRDRKPDKVIGHSLFLYNLNKEELKQVFNQK